MIARWVSLFLGLVAVTGARGEWTLGGYRELGPLPAGAVAWEREVLQDGRKVGISGVSFTAKEATFRVIDNPPSARVDLSRALTAEGAFAGVNGNYFHEDFTPLGLVIAKGTKVHDFEKAKLLSGVLAVRGGRIELVRAGIFKPGPDVKEALQTGPWLVEHGRPVEELNATRLARRTVIASDGEGRWAILATGPLSLADTAQVLALKGLTGSWTIREALNLDGGSSTALVARGSGGALVSIPSFGPVRNYLAIVPRSR